MKYLILCFPFLVSCAALHHVQIGDIESRPNTVLIPFDIKVSEMGLDIGQAGDIARSTKSSGGDRLGEIADIIGLFQMGPRTGNPVYDEKYADRLVYQIYEKCPSGRVTGLNSIRETRAYPVISGEIVKITGFCIKDRAPASASNSVSSEEI